jgi:hypothetical protein
MFDLKACVHLNPNGKCGHPLSQNYSQICLKGNDNADHRSERQKVYPD